MSQLRATAYGMIAVLVLSGYALFYSKTVAFALAIWGLAATAAYRRTYAAVLLGLVMVALIPIYWAPNFPGTKIAASPVTFVCFALLPAALEQRKHIRIGVIDRFVIAFSAVTVVGYILNTSGGVLGSIGGALAGTLLPYATFRLLAQRREMSTAAAIGVVAGGVGSAYIAVREYHGWPNPYFAHFAHGHAHAFFARADTRLGHVRPEAAFGQAIALGMFLALAAVLALALAWRGRDRRTAARPILYGAAALIVFALTENLVRGPLVMLGFAVAILVLTETRRGHWGRGVVIAVAAVALVNVSSFANVLQLRDQTLTQGSRVNLSGEYRIEIWHVVSDPSNFSLVGRQVVDPDGLGYTEAAGVAVGLKSFDNAYALVYIGFGLLALLAFVGIGLRVGKAALVDQMAVIDHAWAAAILAAFINLMTVNLLTQFAHIFWIGIGLVAAAVQRAQSAAETDATGAVELVSAPTSV